MPPISSPDCTAAIAAAAKTADLLRPLAEAGYADPLAAERAARRASHWKRMDKQASGGTVTRRFMLEYEVSWSRSGFNGYSGYSPVLCWMAREGAPCLTALVTESAGQITAVLFERWPRP